MRLQSCGAVWVLALLPYLSQASPLLRGHRLLEADEVEASSEWALASGPVDRIVGTSADNTTVYALNGTSVVALSLSDGKRLWSSKPTDGTPVAVHSWPADPSNLWVCYAFGPLYKVSTEDGSSKKFKADLLQCTDLYMTPNGEQIVYPYSLLASGFKLLSASNGKVVEDFSLPLLVSDTTMSPDGQLLIAKGALSTEAYGFSLASGEREWTTSLELGEFIGKPFFGPDPSVWFAVDSLSGVLRAFKTEDGESLWVSERIRSLGLALSPVITSSADGKTLYLGTDGAGVAVIKAEDGSVERQWTIKPEDIGHESSFFSDVSSAFRTIDPKTGKVYYADAEGSQLVLLDINDGEVLQRITGFGKAKATGFKFSPMTLVSNKGTSEGKGDAAQSYLLLPASWRSPKPGGQLYKIPIIHTT